MVVVVRVVGVIGVVVIVSVDRVCVGVDVGAVGSGSGGHSGSSRKIMYSTIC